ncbi:hypothetical protein AaE_014233 [Aphanomyces astaci]|uniref:Core-binding (CB) domain-containing protein n=1 Tax=Aphanomyces astaci TaxID=112090 RepID=A0A6A4ZFG8_APHAT|nr:hypothetical protein AaE_014233 [Aphanomyces astaci]
MGRGQRQPTTSQPTTSNSTETADDVIALRIVEYTRSQYESILARLVRWLHNEHPQYVTAQRIVVPVTPALCKLMFSYASVKRSLNGYELVPRKYNSVSTINRVKSAVVFLHREAKVELSTELNAMMKEYVSGYRRKFAQLKESGEAPITEGKAALSFGGYVFVTGYKYLASVAVAAESDYSLYVTVHSFLLLCWNLMARAVSTSSIRYEHITWKDDALEIRYGLMKNDQEGRMSYPRHIYANPSNPAICPILSLAVLLFTRGAQLHESPTLLFGYNAKERFSSWLTKTCAANEDDIAGLGLSISDIGTHSFRKGVASALSNSPGGPQAVLVWLRAGWSLGGVQGRYIFEGSGGDQFVGRAATGLNVNDVEFGSLPPHFGPTMALSPSQWESILPGYSSFYPSTFRSAIPYLLASLVHHQAWLKRNLHHSHPLFLSPVWLSGSLALLASEVLGGTLHNPVSKLTATGIPPHIPLYNQLRALESNMGALTNRVDEGFNAIPHQLRIAMDATISSTASVTMDQLQSTLAQFEERLLQNMVQRNPLGTTLTDGITLPLLSTTVNTAITSTN